MDGRVAGHAGLARAGRDVGAELVEPLEHERVGVDGDEDAERAPARGGDDRGRQRGVAAARDRELAALAGAGEAEPLGDLEADEDAEQVARLVRAGDVAGLVLDPDAAVRREPELPRQLVRPGERRHGEAVAVDARPRGRRARGRARVNVGVGAALRVRAWSSVR